MSLANPSSIPIVQLQNVTEGLSTAARLLEGLLTSGCQFQFQALIDRRQPVTGTLLTLLSLCHAR